MQPFVIAAVTRRPGPAWAAFLSEPWFWVSCVLAALLALVLWLAMTRDL